MNIIFKAVMVTTLSLCSVASAQAEYGLQDDDLIDHGLTVHTNIEQQQKFIEAERLLSKNISSAEVTEYKNLYSDLMDYPLQPYLDQQRLLENMQLSSAEEIATFLAKYKNSPLDWPLRKAWLTYLAKQEQGELFLTF